MSSPEAVETSSSKPKISIEMLGAEHDFSSFKSTQNKLNHYLKKRSVPNQTHDFGLTRVAVVPGEKLVRGYYTLCASAILRDDVPEENEVSLLDPPPMIPVVLLGWLAVDRSSTGQGIGDLLMLHALSRAARASREVAIHGVKVNCLNENVVPYYLRFNFRPISADPLCLFLPMPKIRNTPAIQRLMERE